MNTDQPMSALGEGRRKVIIAPDPYDEEPPRSISAARAVAASPKAVVDSDNLIDPRTVDPLHSSFLEDQILDETAKKQGLDWAVVYMKYLRDGYAEYLRWYTKALADAGAPAELVQKAIFSVARDINSYAATSQKHGAWPMGVRLELQAKLVGVIRSHRPCCSEPAPFDNADAVRLYEAMCKQLMLDPARKSDSTQKLLIDGIYEIVADYKRDPPKTMDKWLTQLISMDNSTFIRKLERLPIKLLMEHSSNLWRGINALVNIKKVGGRPVPLQLDAARIGRGDPYAPLPGYHLGIVVLQRDGLLEDKARSEHVERRKVVLADR